MSNYKWSNYIPVWFNRFIIYLRNPADAPEKLGRAEFTGVMIKPFKLLIGWHKLID